MQYNSTVLACHSGTPLSGFVAVRPNELLHLGHALILILSCQLNSPTKSLQSTKESNLALAYLEHSESRLFTLEEYGTRGLWKMSVSAGGELRVLPSVLWRTFHLVNEGIYFIPEPPAGAKSSIQFLSFRTGKVKTVTPSSGSSAEGLTVSPDGRSLLFSQRDEAGSDLLLVENFR